MALVGTAMSIAKPEDTEDCLQQPCEVHACNVTSDPAERSYIEKHG